MLITISVYAQEDVVVTGYGLMSEESPMLSQVKNNLKASVKIPVIKEHASFYLYNYDFKKDINRLKNCEIFYNQDLRGMGSLTWSVSLLNKKICYAFFAQGGFSMVCPRDIPAGKFNMFGFHSVEFKTGELVPMAMVTDDKAKISKELMNRILSKSKIEDISIADIQEVLKVTEYFSIIAYTIIKWKK